MTWRHGRAPSLVPLALIACDGAASEPRAQVRDLGDGEVALVASERIDADTVRAIAAAQGTSLSVARDRAIRDALFALEARALGRGPRTAESALLARALLEDRRRDLDGPVTDEELAAATRRHWFELDRPEGFQVVHTVVMVSPKSGDDVWTTAAAVAKEVADRIAPVADRARDAAANDDAVLAELKRITSAVEPRGLKSKVEALAAVAADGRVVAPGGGELVKEFAAAVAKLRERGDVAGPFRSKFGWHVAVLLARTPPLSVPIERRRVLLRDEVLDWRLQKERAALTAPLAPTVELATNAAALLDLVPVVGGDEPTASRPK